MLPEPFFWGGGGVVLLNGCRSFVRLEAFFWGGSGDERPEADAWRASSRGNHRGPLREALIAQRHTKPKAFDFTVLQCLEGLRGGATEEARRCYRGANASVPASPTTRSPVAPRRGVAAPDPPPVWLHDGCFSAVASF